MALDGIDLVLVTVLTLAAAMIASVGCAVGFLCSARRCGHHHPEVAPLPSDNTNDMPTDLLLFEEVFVNPRSAIFHKKGCSHLGSAAKAFRQCKHCMPALNVKLYKSS